MNLEIAIEAVLFYKTEPVSKTELIAFFDVSTDEIEGALHTLSERLQHGATRLIVAHDKVQLVSAPEVAETIERLRKEEISRDIGKAGAETLAIILYRGPVSRADIDFIRGVNSTFILRNLQIRGLIERIAHPTLPRSYQYRATPAIFAHLGITNKDELPEYTTVMDALDTYEREATAMQAAAPEISDQ